MRLCVHMKEMVVGVNICCVLQIALHFLTPLQNVVMSNAWRPCGSEIPLNERVWKKKLIRCIQIKYLFLAKNAALKCCRLLC